ncbi:hypothetical protein BD311DRAFT_675772 [Dichomitus squalens]|uniref:Uncharacterized protein n=1 Tax=Dichomitus squalens TaxID=114155 RepID=A0A4Q9M6S6_9APHY|nr:hypothetical protein BD311DRAFT_675772 [Dichomitus squalens]
MNLITVLHPRYKLAYFMRQEWSPEWIEEARELVRAEWRANYKPAAPSGPPSNDAPTAATQGASRHPGPGRLSAQASANAVRTRKPAYLEAPPLTTVLNPLEYWSPLLSSVTDADLARMALDFLSVPGMHVVTNSQS